MYSTVTVHQVTSVRVTDAQGYGAAPGLKSDGRFRSIEIRTKDGGLVLITMHAESLAAIRMPGDSVGEFLDGINMPTDDILADAPTA